MMCAHSEGLVPKEDNWNILCKAVPCNPTVDTGTCCKREYKQVVAGDHQTCALDMHGRPVCWGSWQGYNEEWKNHPGPYKDISTRGEVTCAVRIDDGAIDCWTPSASAAMDFGLSGGGAFTNVTVGVDHICALRDTGVAACTGINMQSHNATSTDFPATADSSIEPSATDAPPIADTIGLVETGAPGNAGSTKFLQASSGATFTCGIDFADQSVKCWGRNDRGQSRPPDHGQASGAHYYTRIAAGQDHACGISNGSAYCWGEDNNGQASAPTGHDFVEISAGGSHTCALKANGRVVCWGANADGQSTPSQDGSDDGGPYKTITAGKAHTCAIKSSDYSMVCWGSNFDEDASGSLVWRGQSEPPPAGSWP